MVSLLILAVGVPKTPYELLSASVVHLPCCGMPVAARAPASIFLSWIHDTPQLGWLQVDAEKPAPENSFLVFLDMALSCLS